MSTPVRPGADSARPAPARPEDPAPSGPAVRPPSFHRLLREASQAKASGPRQEQSARQAVARQSEGEPSRRAAAADGKAYAAAREPAPESSSRGAQVSDPAEADAPAVWELLLQAIPQAGQPAADAAADPSALIPADLDVIRKLAELLYSAKPMPDNPDGTRPVGNPLLARLGELLAQMNGGEAANPGEAPSAGLGRLLQDLRAHLTAGDPKPMAPPAAVMDDMAAGIQTAQEPAGSAPPTPAAAAADSPAEILAEMSKPIHPRLVKPDVGSGKDGTPPGHEIKPAVVNPNPRPEPAAPAAEGSAEHAQPSKPFGAQASSVAEALRSHPPAEPARPAEAATGSPEMAPAARQEEAADGGGSHQPGDERLLTKPLQVAETAAGPEGGTDPTERFQAELREVRQPRAADSSAPKAAEGSSVRHERDGSAATLRTGVFDQIVQRAVVQVRHELGEIKIDLKPEFLGNVRMQIVSDNQQVTVRILTDLPVVRDMIESGFQQLKSELQSQGLHVERLEVAVAEDQRQNPWRQARKDGPRKDGGTPGRVAAAEMRPGEERPAPVYARPGTGRFATIDTFV